MNRVGSDKNYADSPGKQKSKSPKSNMTTENQQQKSNSTLKNASNNQFNQHAANQLRTFDAKTILHAPDQALAQDRLYERQAYQRNMILAVQPRMVQGTSETSDQQISKPRMDDLQTAGMNSHI